MLNDYPDVLSVSDVMSILHLGRSKTYELLRLKAIPSIRLGKKFIVPKSMLIEFLNSKE